MQLRSFYLQRRNLKMVWSSHMQRKRESKHPLMQRLPEMGESAPERLENYCMILERMWEHPHHSTGRGGHQIGTIDTWL